MEMQIGTSNIHRGGGVIGLTPNKFSRSPIIICQLARSSHYVWSPGHLNICTFNFTRNSFQYIVKGDVKPGDQIHWIAVGN